MTERVSYRRAPASLIEAWTRVLHRAEEDAAIDDREEADEADLLLAMVENGVAGRVFAALGVDAEAAREAVARVRKPPAP